MDFGLRARSAPRRVEAPIAKAAAPQPLTFEEAVGFCGRLRAAPAAVEPVPSPRRWDRFAELVAGLGLRGNDVPDAFLAATALDLRASVATFDRGFRRFPGLSVCRPGD